MFPADGGSMGYDYVSITINYPSDISIIFQLDPNPPCALYPLYGPNPMDVE